MVTRTQCGRSGLDARPPLRPTSFSLEVLCLAVYFSRSHPYHDPTCLLAGSIAAGGFLSVLSIMSLSGPLLRLYVMRDFLSHFRFVSLSYCGCCAGARIASRARYVWCCRSSPPARCAPHLRGSAVRFCGGCTVSCNSTSNSNKQMQRTLLLPTEQSFSRLRSPGVRFKSSFLPDAFQPFLSFFLFVPYSFVANRFFLHSLRVTVSVTLTCPVYLCP
jgi:hypothetical protein